MIKMNQLVKFWQSKGRVNREELVFGTILLLILWLPIFLFTTSSSKFFIYSSIFILLIYLLQTAKRYHDLNKNGINGFVWFIIPFINVIFFIELYFKKGTEGENKYGQPSLFRIKNVFKKIVDYNSKKEYSSEIAGDHAINSQEESLFELIFDESYVLPEDKKHEPIYLLKWFVKNGEWVKREGPLFKLRVGDWIAVNSSFSSQPIVTKKSGFLRINKQEGELIQIGDRICTIIPQALYDLENSPLNSIYRASLKTHAKSTIIG